MIKSILLSVLLVSLACCSFNSCQAQRLEKKLDPESSEFLSLVKYIMTSDEYKQFINLPAGERSKFMEDFWKRRDPDPATEENEFKEAYLARLNEANQIFGKGLAGYLSDRGMIYVLFGPPDQIYYSSVLRTGGEKVRQIWLYSLLLDKYHNVQIYFIDRFGSGNFELESGGQVFSLIQEAKSNYLGILPKNKGFQYTVHLKELDKKGDNTELLIRIEIPYRNIWFSKAADKMEAALSLEVKILDASENNIWEHKQDYPVSIVENKLEETLSVREKHVIEIPVTLSKGKYSLHVHLVDKTGEKEEKKVLPFKI